MTVLIILKMVQGYIHSIVKKYEKDLQKVKQNGYNLKDVKQQTPELCLEAVKQNGYALNYVKEKMAELCLAAVKKTGYALQFVNEQTPELCLAAVKQNRFALQFIRDLQLREHIAHHKDLYKSSIFIPLS